MDKGAHFRKCDFQVHTPRDIGWIGTDAVTPEERKTYAEELILACRKKGVTSIAITDHHDFEFFPYIKEAAGNELDEKGAPVSVQDQIVVFPGLELTLTAPTSQALLLLDSGFPENLLPSVLTALSLTSSPGEEAKTATVERIPQGVVSGLTDLYKKLTSHQGLEGRFIVLPNVTDGGHGTMLRSGFANYYKSMPCVGGYTDGPVTKLGAGNLSIVNGKNREYGFKAIGIFQTSDNRKRTHEDLGKYTTWVKWSEPTAEALRQACLAKESRMSQDEPELPSVWITGISVSNSKFLGRVKLDINQQYSALIGGRGTGKSTILEYLRWGLCDQPVDDDFDIAVVQSKRKKLIDDTLQKHDGEVHVTFLLNGIRHIVKRSSKTQEILLRIGESDFFQATEKDVRNLLPIQAYSQKQLSNVGVRVEELKRFVELPVKKIINQIRSDIRDTASEIRRAYGNLIRKNEIETEMGKYTIEIASLKEQLQQLRDGLKGLSEKEQTIITQKTKYDTEEQIVEDFKNELARTTELVTGLKTQIGEESQHDNSALDLQNPELLAEIENEFKTVFSQVRSHLRDLMNLFDEGSLKTVNQKTNEWQKLKIAFEDQYEKAKANATVNQQQLNQIQTTEQRISDLNRLQNENHNTLAALVDSESTYKAFRAKWDSSHGQKLETLKTQCEKFSILSNGLIKAEMTNSIDVELIKKQFKAVFAGMNVREQKIDELCQQILTSPDPVAAWNEILAELESLARHTVGGTEPLPTTATLRTCGFIDTERTRIAANFDSQKWLDLSLVELEFNPVFHYCTNQDTNEFIDFADASAGQQATALLTVLLNQEGAPLIIDQPEDDIDSKMVSNIIEQIWKAKSKRQLIFASHNANFVVNGDAELVVCCDYIKAGDQTAGQIKNCGAIDNRTIKEEITTITEGGRQAFKLRMEKYGF